MAKDSTTVSRDEYRTKLLESSKGSTKILPFNGLDVEFRHLTIDQLGEINNKDLKGGERIVSMIVAAAYIPGTEELIFEEGDFAALRDLKWSPEMQAIQNFFNQMFVGSIEDEEKN